MFGNEIPVKPFGKRARYKDNYWLYENYKVGNNNLKLDVWFDIDGTASLEFWNPSTLGEKGREILTKILNDIGLFGEFEQNYYGYAGNGYRKNFQFGPTLTNMTDIDNAILGFVKDFMTKLSGPKLKQI